LINTHSNGDHYFGNGLVEGARIISSAICAEEMKIIPPAKMALLMKLWWLLGKAGRYVHSNFKQFDFRGIPLVLPHQTFSDNLKLQVGKKVIELIEVKDAHTGSDVMVFLPEDKVIFCADLLFIDGTPVVWTQGVQSWIDALDRIISLDVDHIVPGHGPVTDKEGVSRLKAYFEYIDAESKKRFSQNMNILDAALDIDLKEFSNWGEPERVVTTVHAIYQELNPAMKPLNAVKLFGLMYDYNKISGNK
jgi:glyoxylase-like metal-dependent hydrolase (beta-lactamase superfamily II)